jgi:hypothetical protein
LIGGVRGKMKEVHLRVYESAESVCFMKTKVGE